MRRVPYSYLLWVPLLLILCGAASNQMVLLANWGKFPVMLNHRVEKEMEQQSDLFGNVFSSIEVTETNKNNDGMLDDIHCVMTHQTRLNYLADWINLKTVIASPGDLLLWLGDWLFTYTWVMWMALMIRKVLTIEE